MPDILRYLGLKEESSFNPGTPPASEIHLDIASATLDSPTEAQMIYDGGMGRAPKLHRPGFYNPTGNIVYAFDIKTIAFLLKWALGGYAFTAGLTVVDGSSVEAVDDNGTYRLEMADADASNLPEVGDVIVLSGFTEDQNNGNFKVLEILEGQGGTTDETHITVEQTLVNEAGTTITIQHLNVQEAWGSGDVILDSFTARLGKDTFEHVFAGCVINSLEISVEGEYCMATADISSARDSKATIKNISDLALPDEYPLAFHEVTASLRGVDRSCDVKSLTLTINNNLDAESGRGLGTRYPCRIPAGQREVTLAKTLYFENTEELEQYWGAEDGPDDTIGSTEFAVELNFDAGIHGEMTITIPKFIYTQTPLQPSGRDEMEQETEGRAFQEGDVQLEDASTVDTDIYASISNNSSEVTS